MKIVVIKRAEVLNAVVTIVGAFDFGGEKNIREASLSLEEVAKASNYAEFADVIAQRRLQPTLLQEKLPAFERKVKIFGQEVIDVAAIDQLKSCLTAPEDIGVLTADAHYGYGHPIGGAIAYKNKVSLSGVGFDIACGNKAVRTNVKAADIDIKRVMTEISQVIGFGVGRPNPQPIQHEVLDRIANADFRPQREFAKMAAEQLGTVGGGNHFVDLFVDDAGFVWIGVHFGSRGFGHKTTTGFIALSQGLGFTDHGKEGSKDARPVLFDVSSQLGQDYLSAVNLAGDYAYAGRDIVVDRVLQILGAQSNFSVHNHHNFVWKEKHFGEDYWVVRKGCTPAFPGQQSFIGANMLDHSVIVEGVDCAEARAGLYSTVHGAGRVLSRTQAAGKVKWQRDKTGKMRPVTVGKGLVDFEQVRTRLQSADVCLIGAAADEAPECYKNLKEVLAYQGPTIKVLHSLRPIGVIMAGSETYDPYKD